MGVTISNALASSMEKSSFKADFTKELALSISESSISLSTLVTFWLTWLVACSLACTEADG